MSHSEEDRFRITVLELTDLIHELTTHCYNEGVKTMNPSLIILGKSYLASLDKTDVIKAFINNSYGPKDNSINYWDEIRDRNEQFFIKHSDSIFENVPVGKGNMTAFKTLFTAKDDEGSNIIDDDDRDAVWDMFFSLVKICIKYIHKVRKCILVEIDGKWKRRYQKNFFPRIKVLTEAKKWDIELEMPQIPIIE